MFVSAPPQTARWKVTSKEALQRIGEYSEAAITIRGTYFPPGKEPKEGERKIYLAIESMCGGNDVNLALPVSLSLIEVHFL